MLALTQSEQHAMDQLSCVELWGGNRPVDTQIKLAGLEGWLCSRPFQGARAGGDVYYLSSCSDGALTRASIADVSGHGADVSEAAGRLRDMMRQHIETFDHAQVMHELNEQFGEMGGGGLFATAILLSYYRRSGHLLYSLAGHPPPLWHSTTSDSWRFLQADDSCDVDGAPNLPLGVLNGTNYCQTYIRMAVGDTLVLYTDGVVEAENPRAEQLGRDGLLEIVRQTTSLPAAETAHHIRDAVARFRDTTPPEDDVTLVVLQRTE